VDLLGTWCYVRARLNLGNERGASLIEYALLLALVAVVCIGAISLLGNSSSTKLSQAGGSITGS
jgi:pilus assembly protein Flp/PilA